MRITDKLTPIWTPRGMMVVGSESPADTLILPWGGVLLECKETTGVSFSYNYLKTHQVEALLDFRRRGKEFKAYVVVQYKDVPDEPYLCVAVPIRKWLHEELHSGRKSLHWTRAVEIGIRLRRVKGSMWSIARIVSTSRT
jgi:Holliday junction resolvase